MTRGDGKMSSAQAGVEDLFEGGSVCSDTRIGVGNHWSLGKALANLIPCPFKLQLMERCGHASDPVGVYGAYTPSACILSGRYFHKATTRVLTQACKHSKNQTGSGLSDFPKLAES